MARTPAHDPYAGINLDNIRQLMLAGWSSAMVVVALLLVLDTPPTVALGTTGIWIESAVMGVNTAGVVLLARRPELFGFRILLAVTWLIVGSIAAGQWLCGGWHAPFHELLLPVLLLVVAGHPLSRALPLVLVIFCVALLPGLYDPDRDQLRQMLLEIGVWTMLVVIVHKLMTRVRAQRVATSELARSDALTSLANRRAFDERIAEREGTSIALVIADVDDFKGINDAFGHLEGDRVLAAVAAALVDSARSDDEVFRWGGDEFALLLGRVEEHGVGAFCARLEAGVAERVRRPDGSPVRITFGWACGPADDDVDALTARADALLRDRKAGVPRAARLAA